MSNSYKKQPWGGITCARSDRPGKIISHRKYRHYADRLANDDEWDYICPRKHLENRYDWPKDGKRYWPKGLADYKFMGK